MATSLDGDPMITVRVDGMDDLRKALRQVNLSPLLKDVHRSIGRFVIDRAGARLSNLKAKFPAYDKVTLKESANQKEVQVIVGPKTVGYAAEFGAYGHTVFGHEWGADRMKRRVWPFWTGNQFTLAGSGQTSGLMVLPTVAEYHDEIADRYMDAVDKATRDAFPEGAAR